MQGSQTRGKNSQTGSIPLSPDIVLPALQALSQTMFFFDTQREGYLPLSNPVSWRGNAFVADYNTSATLAAATPNASFGDLGFGFGSVSEGRGCRQAAD